MLSHKNQRAAGFTLVEILVVVVILGIAAAIIIPQIGSRDDLIASSAARTLMADLIYAQNQAIATQKNQFVQFTGQHYAVQTRDTDTSPFYTLTNPVSLNPYTEFFGVTGTPLEKASIASTNFGGPSTVGFDYLGSPFSYDSSTSTVTSLTNSASIVIQSGGASLTVSIEPYTGELTVQ